MNDDPQLSLKPEPENSNRRRSAMADRLSLLPDDLLHHILSLLPSTNLRAQTSVLSRRFRHLWISTPSLDFSYPSDSAAVIDRCLRLYPNSTLRRLRIDILSLDPPPIGSLDHWIRFAASRSATALAFCFDIDSLSHLIDEKPQLPPSLFLLSSSISSLKLSCFTFPQIAAESFLGFPSLKTLFLEYVSISDESVDFLIKKSPFLETLSLNCCPNVTRIEINSVRNPNIENLKLAICRINENDGRVVVDAPRLRFFDYNGKIEKVELKDLGSLVGAEISAFSSELCRSKEQWMGIVSAISSVQVLSVSSWFFQFVLSEVNGESFETRGPMFRNLKEFRWDELALKQSNMRGIIFFLRECPMLEALYIHLDFYAALINDVMQEQGIDEIDELDSDAEFDEGEPSEPPFMEPSEPSDELPAESNKDEEIERLFEDDGHLLSRLTMVSIAQFSGFNEEMHFLEFILRKATILKLLNLIIVALVEKEQLCGRIFGIPSPSPNLKIDLPKIPSASPDLEIDMWGKLTTKPRGFRIYRDLWDF